MRINDHIGLNIFFAIIFLWFGSGVTLADTGKGIKAAGGGFSFVLSDYNGFNTSCNGASDGSIDITPFGAAPFAFQWSNGSSSEDISGLTAGTYTLTMTDNIGGVYTGSMTLTEPPVLSVSLLSFQNVQCNGGSDGSINVDVTGGASNYSFVWSNSALTQNVSGLSASTYTVTVTDQNGCTDELTQSISEPSVLQVNLDNIQNVSCNGGTDGAISISVLGGTPSYNLLWSNGSLLEDLTVVPAGFYTVTVTDQNGCTAQLTDQVTEPPNGISIALNQLQNVLCNGASTGAIDINVSGGSSGFSYLWSNGANTEDLLNIPAATYTVTVTDQNNCTAQFSQIITQPAALAVTLSSVQNVLCNGASTGAVNINVSGGTPGYSYLWSNGAITQDLSLVPAGTYTVTVTDQNSCTAQLSQNVSQPATLNVTLASVQSVLCNGASTGAVSINFSGGTPGYSYLWSNGAITQDISLVPAGAYTVTVTDQNSCTAQFSQVVTQPASAVSATTSTTSPNCAANNGSASVNAAGGTPNYIYLWNTGSTNQTINGLGVGTYTVTVTDLNSCTFVTTAQVNSSLGPAISSATVSNVTCNGFSNGAIDITITGGAGTISYLWSNGAITQDLSGVVAGVYTVTVTDQSSCTAIGSYTITSPPAINLSFSSVQPGCLISTGSISAIVSGGTPGYTYLWSNGFTTATITNLSAATYTVTVADNASCTASNSFTLNAATSPVISLNALTNVSCNGGNDGAIDITITGGLPAFQFQWSNSATTEDISGLISGSYTVTVSDAQLCTSTSTFTVGQPAPFTITPFVTPASCGVANGTASVSVSGDTPPYTYLWSTGATNAAISGLAAGSYTVTVSGFTGCTASQTINVSAGSALLVTSDSVLDINCFSVLSGAIYITAAGSSSPYQYLWNDGSILEDRTGLAAGTYTVTVTGADGCTGTASATINLPSQVSVTFNANAASCGQSNGSATVIPAGGLLPYTFLWSDNSTSSSISNVPAGIYTVTVSAASGCTALDSVVILNIGAPVINLISQNLPACDGSPTGAILVDASGGQPAYTYLWSNGETTAQISNLGYGIYTVTVTDANACSAFATFNLGSPLQVSLQNFQNNFCLGGNNGFINITITGGQIPYTYLWSDGATTQNIQNLIAGTYTVTVTDFLNCTAQFVYTIADPTAIGIAGTINDVSCSGAGGSISLNVSGGTIPYTYLWSNGETTAIISGLTAGDYTVTVTDDASCSSSATFTVNSAISLAASFQLIQPVSCAGFSDASLSVVASGGQFPYLYLWSNGSTSPLISNIPAGIYTVTITDDAGCQSFFNDTISEPLPLSFAYTATNPSCGVSNGVISVQANGGTSPYTYLWSNGTGASTISAIPAGTYTVTVTDSSFCQLDTTFNLINTGSIQILSVIDSVSCFNLADGAIDLTIVGGLAPFSFTWINTPQTTEDVTGLSAGNYSVIVTDFSGCTASESFTLNQPTPINISFPLLQNAACGNANGGVIANANGAFPTFTYLWSTGVQNPGLFNIAAGSYTVTVTDSKGCTATNVANISNNTGPVFNSVDSGMVTCFGGTNGFININVTGSSPPFTYSWTGSSATVPAINNLVAGIYTLQVTDAQNCISVRSVTITQPDSLRINPVILQNNPPYNISCFGEADGQILLSVNGGVPPFTYLWSNGATTQNLVSLVAGPYNVIATDQAGCSVEGSYNLAEPPQLVANAGQNVTICGTSSYVMQATAPPVGFGFWTSVNFPGVVTFSDSTSNNSTVSNLQEGDNIFLWTVTLGSCSTVVQVTITRGTSITASAGTDLTICESTITLNATNPQFGFGFWRTFTPGVVIDNTSAAITGASNLQLGNNIFLWTVISGNCRDSAEINIFRKDSLDCLSIIRLPTAFSPNNDGFNDVYLIKGLFDFPDNSLTIFNRWGVVVYESNGYRNDWDGRGLDNVPVTDGTYFAILRVRSTDEVFKSYIDLRR